MKKVLISLASVIFISACSPETTDNESTNAETTTEEETSNNESVTAERISLEEGVHYEVLENPIEAEENEIIEFIWYHCSHCYTVEQVMQNNAQRIQDSGVFFSKEHALVSSNWEEDGRLFYALRHLGKEKQGSTLFFDFFHNENTSLTEENILEQLEITEAELQEALSSDAVEQMMDESRQKALQIKLTGTPTFIVEGKYKVLVSGINTYEELLQVAIQLAQEK